MQSIFVESCPKINKKQFWLMHKCHRCGDEIWRLFYCYFFKQINISQYIQHSGTLRTRLIQKIYAIEFFATVQSSAAPTKARKSQSMHKHRISQNQRTISTLLARELLRMYRVKYQLLRKCHKYRQSQKDPYLPCRELWDKRKTEQAT